jgi:hypothetical protein
MTSHIQGSIKGLLLAAATAAVAMTSLQASAQTPPRGAGPRGPTPTPRPAIRATPPMPQIVVLPCKRNGPGITPC